MAAIGEIGASSFDSYEGIRIVIPGLITYAAASTAFKTVAPGEGGPLFDDPVLSLVASLIVGLILYFWDLPARAASYTENQPTEYLEVEYSHVKPSELLTAYLLALNTKMPATIRNRSLYMGSMYRIGIEMILTIGLASAVVFAVSLFDYGTAEEGLGGTGRRIAAGALVLSFVLSVFINRGYERKSAARSRTSPRRLEGPLLKDLRHRSMWVYVTGILLLTAPNLTVIINALPQVGVRGLAASGLAICIAYWAQRYLLGDANVPGDPRRRKRLHSTSAGLLFLLPLVVALSMYGPGEESVLPTGSHLAGWTAAAGLVGVSIVIRGHERKLHGAYRGQTRWLKENPEAMKDVLPKPP